MSHIMGNRFSRADRGANSGPSGQSKSRLRKKDKKTTTVGETVSQTNNDHDEPAVVPVAEKQVASDFLMCKDGRNNYAIESDHRYFYITKNSIAS